MTTEKKPMSGAERTAKSYKSRVDMGLIQVKVWVHPVEAVQVRDFTNQLPKTRGILEKIINSR